jgi:archaellum component FlaG (FlaF/FlaG flagellin family)
VTSSDTAPPRDVSTVPNANETGVARTIDVKATFSEGTDGSSITPDTFKLFKKGSTTKIAATVSYEANTDTATLNPGRDLTSGVTYEAVVTTGTKDVGDK